MNLFNYLIDEYTLTTSELEEKWNGEHTNNKTPSTSSDNK